MAQNAEIHDRIKTAMQVYAMHSREQRTSHEDFGRAVAQQERRQRAYLPSEVFDWMRGRTVPRLVTLMAIADLAGYEDEVQRGYLAYGDEQSIHGLSEDDYQRVYGARIMAEG